MSYTTLNAPECRTNSEQELTRYLSQVNLPPAGILPWYECLQLYFLTCSSDMDAINLLTPRRLRAEFGANCDHFGHFANHAPRKTRGSGGRI